jgi:hypothetical protein
MVIIGIASEAGSGKDSAADILVETYGLLRVSMADVLKRFLEELFEVPERLLWGSSENRNQPYFPNGASIRRGLQTLGDWGRELDPKCFANYWRTYVLAHIEEHERTARRVLTKPYKNPGYICPDVRYREEVDVLHEMGGKVYRVVRPEDHANRPKLPELEAAHSSETTLKTLPEDVFDGILYNDSTLAAWHQQIRALASGGDLR